jgi:hypothetical protein
MHDPPATQPPPSADSPLVALDYERLQFLLVAEATAQLPPFHGSMLRGAFGWALRGAACVYEPSRPCAPCDLRQLCCYARLFEPPPPAVTGPFLRGRKQGIRPYVVEPRSRATHFSPGNPLEFDLLLFGRAVALASVVSLAVQRLAAGGLGAGRYPFRLVEIESAGPAPLPAAPLAPLGERARLHFITPARIFDGGRQVDPGTHGLRALALAIAKRALELGHAHGGGAEIPIRPWLDRTDAVRIEQSTLRFEDLDRYSNRQGCTVPIGGLVGSLDLAGDLGSLSPLLAAAEVLHVGKGTTYGLGQVRVEAMDK